jgi:hypothetical protein
MRVDAQAEIKPESKLSALADEWFAEFEHKDRSPHHTSGVQGSAGQADPARARERAS